MVRHSKTLSMWSLFFRIVWFFFFRFQLWQHARVGEANERNTFFLSFVRSRSCMVWALPWEVANCSNVNRTLSKNTIIYALGPRIKYCLIQYWCYNQYFVSTATFCRCFVHSFRSHVYVSRLLISFRGNSARRH